MMTLPEPTHDLLRKLRRTAVFLDTVAAHAKTDRAYDAAHDAANTIWVAIHRIEDLAGIVEDMAPTFDREPDEGRPA
jgi:hypothetical protein